MKRLVMLALLSVMGLSLVACGEQKKEEMTPVAVESAEKPAEMMEEKSVEPAAEMKTEEATPVAPAAATEETH